MPLVTPSIIPSPALPLPDSIDLATWGARMQELHTWMTNVSAPGQNALGTASYENALFAQTMAGQALASANFKGAWSSLTGALNMPASVSHSGKIWLLTANLANVATATPGVSGSWLNITNFLMGVATLADAKTALGLGATTAENLIVNGDGRINQRGYVSGTPLPGAIAPGTLDRWHLMNNSESLTFVTSGNKRTMTAPATGVQQTVPGSDIAGGTYVLNWTGTAICLINTVAYTKGAAITLTAGANVAVVLKAGTFADVQLELGSVPTQFQARTYAEELDLCQFHYERRVGVGAIGIRSYGTASDSAFQVLSFKPKKAIPTITKIGTWAATNCGQPTITDVTDSSCIVRATVTATGSYTYSTGAGQGIEIDCGL